MGIETSAAYRGAAVSRFVMFGSFVLAAVTKLSACGFLLPRYTADPTAAHKANIERVRADVVPRPGVYAPAAVSAATVKGLQNVPTALDKSALVQEAVGYLDAVNENGLANLTLTTAASRLVWHRPCGQIERTQDPHKAEQRDENQIQHQGRHRS